LLPENALRVMLKQNKLPALFIGTKAYINYDLLCQQLGNIGVERVAVNEK